jgi:hypothetical protein
MTPDGRARLGPGRTRHPSTHEGVAGSTTRGFLFAELRRSTAFVEARGAVQAAELLLRYRDLARGAVSRFAGAEIRTEGDSFAGVFSAASAAVLCGLAIVDIDRVDAAGHADASIAVGVGVRAGETVETPDHPGQPAGDRVEWSERGWPSRGRPGVPRRSEPPLRDRLGHRRLRSRSRRASAIRDVLQGRRIGGRREGRPGHRPGAGLRPGTVAAPDT